MLPWQCPWWRHPRCNPFHLFIDCNPCGYFSHFVVHLGAVKWWNSHMISPPSLSHFSLLFDSVTCTWNFNQESQTLLLDKRFIDSILFIARLLCPNYCFESVAVGHFCKWPEWILLRYSISINYRTTVCLMLTAVVVHVSIWWYIMYKVRYGH